MPADSKDRNIITEKTSNNFSNVLNMVNHSKTNGKLIQLYKWYLISKQKMYIPIITFNADSSEMGEYAFKIRL